MTGGDFASLADFRDIESINAWHQYADTGKIPPEDMMRYLQYKSRTTPGRPCSGTIRKRGIYGRTPWIRVNPNYKEINARDQLARKDSVFHYYQQLIGCGKRTRSWCTGSMSCFSRRIRICSSTPGPWEKKSCWCSVISKKKRNASRFRRLAPRTDDPPDRKLSGTGVRK